MNRKRSIKQILSDIKPQINSNTGDFNTPLLPIHRSSDQTKQNKKTPQRNMRVR